MTSVLRSANIDGAPVAIPRVTYADLIDTRTLKGKPDRKRGATCIGWHEQRVGVGPVPCAYGGAVGERGTAHGIDDRDANGGDSDGGAVAGKESGDRVACHEG